MDSSAVSARYRPVGVVLAACVLALLALGGLGFVVLILISALFMHVPRMPNPGLVQAFQLLTAFFLLGVSVFCAFTVVGLFRMKNWARVSIVVIGALETCFCLLLMLIYGALAFVPALGSASTTAQVSPVLLKAVFLGLAGGMFVFSLIGIWWFIYFTRRSVRALFTEKRELPVAFSPDGVTAGQPKPGRSVNEVLLTCLGVLYLVGAPWMIAVAFMQIPMFFLGVIFRGNAASVLMLALATLNLAIGVGLLRRNRPAWFGALFINAIGLLSSLIILLPRGRHAFQSYQQEITQHLLGPAMAPSPVVSMQNSMIFISLVPGVVMLVVVIWFLFHVRGLFESKFTVKQE